MSIFAELVSTLKYLVSCEFAAASLCSVGAGILVAHSPELGTAAWWLRVPMRRGSPTGSIWARAEGAIIPFPGMEVKSFRCCLSPEGILEDVQEKPMEVDYRGSSAFIMWLLWENEIYHLSNSTSKRTFGR